jgi:hypothetical protein
MSIFDQISALTHEIKSKQLNYHSFIGSNGWKHKSAENMRREILELVELRCILEETLTEIEKELTQCKR